MTFVTFAYAGQIQGFEKAVDKSVNMNMSGNGQDILGLKLKYSSSVVCHTDYC